MNDYINMLTTKVRTLPWKTHGAVLGVVGGLVLLGVLAMATTRTSEVWPDDFHVRVRVAYDSATVNQSCGAFPAAVFIGAVPAVAGFDLKLLGAINPYDSIRVRFRIPGRLDQDTIWRLDASIPCISVTDGADRGIAQ